MISQVCQACSALTDTEKSFCPECGTPYQQTSQTEVAADYAPSVRTACIIAWGGVGLYVAAFLIDAIHFEDWGGAAEFYSGYFIRDFGLGWSGYIYLLIYPGLALALLAVAVILTRSARRR
jgi:hypothetical protein